MATTKLGCTLYRSSESPSLQIYARESDGTWALIPGGNVGDFGAGIQNALQGLDDGKIIAGGTNASFVDGALELDPTTLLWSFTDVASTTNAFCRDLHAPDRDTNPVWGIATSGGEWFKYNGSSWSRGLIGGTAGDAIWAVDDQEAWVVGGGGGNQQIWHTTNGGTNWTNLWSQSVTDSGYAGVIYRGVWGFSSTEVYFSGFTANNGYLIRWNGTNFVAIGMTPAGRILQKCWGYNDGANNIVVSSGAVSGNAVWIWRYNQSTFTEVYTDSTTWNGGSVYEVSGLSDGSVIITHGNSFAGPTCKESTDGGLTWADPDVSWPQNQSPSREVIDSDEIVIGDLIDPVIDTNTPTGTIDDTDPSIAFITKDPGGSGVDINTINCTVEGENAIVNGIFQAGWDGAGSSINSNAFDGFDVVIDPSAQLDVLTTINVNAECDDVSGNSTSLGWTFYISTPIVSSASAVNDRTVRVVFNKDMKRTSSTDADDALNPLNYTIVGGIRELRVTAVVEVSATEFDLTVQEMQDGTTYIVVVDTDVADDGVATTIADSSSVVNYDRASYIGLGVPPRLESVTVNQDRTLTVAFNEAMLRNAPLERQSTYVIEPIGNALPVFLTGVTVNGQEPETVTLSYKGGGSVYRITVNGVQDLAGNYIDPGFNSLLFELVAPEDEVERYFFETNLGAIHLEVESLSRREIENLVLRRTKNAGHEEQLRLVSEALRNAGISRDDTRLKIFKG